MLIHIQIARGLQLQIEAAVLGEQLQHVIEEANAGGDLVAAAAIDLQRAADLRLFGDCARLLADLIDVSEHLDARLPAATVAPVRRGAGYVPARRSR